MCIVYIQLQFFRCKQIKNQRSKEQIQKQDSKMQSKPLHAVETNSAISTVLSSETPKLNPVRAANKQNCQADQIKDISQPVSSVTEKTAVTGIMGAKKVKAQSKQAVFQVRVDGNQSLIAPSPLVVLGVQTSDGCQKNQGTHKDVANCKKSKQKSPKKTQKNKKLSITKLKTKNSNINTSNITNIINGSQYKTLTPIQQNPIGIKTTQQKLPQPQKPLGNKIQSHNVKVPNNNPCSILKNPDPKFANARQKNQSTQHKAQNQLIKPGNQTHAQYINDLQFNTLNSQCFKQSKNVSLLNVLAKSIQIGGKSKARSRGNAKRGLNRNNQHGEHSNDKSCGSGYGKNCRHSCECENCNIRMSFNKRISSIDSYMRPESWHNQPLYKGDNHKANNTNRYACMAQNKYKKNQTNQSLNLKSQSNSNLKKIENHNITATNPETAKSQFEPYPKLQKNSQFHPNPQAIPVSYLQPHNHSQVPKTSSYRVFLKYLNTNISAEYNNINNICNQLNQYEQQQMKKSQGAGYQQREQKRDQIKEQIINAQQMINRFGIKNTFNKHIQKMNASKSNNGNYSQANSLASLVSKNKDTDIPYNPKTQALRNTRSNPIKNSMHNHLIHNPKSRPNPNSNKNPQTNRQVHHSSQGQILPQPNPQKYIKQINEKELDPNEDALREAGLYQFKNDYQFFLGRYYQFIKSKKFGYVRPNSQTRSPQQPVLEQEHANSNSIGQQIHKSISEIRKSRKLKAPQLLSTTPQPKASQKTHPNQKNKTQQSNVQPLQQYQFSQLQSQLQSQCQQQKYYQLQAANMEHLASQQQLLQYKISGELGMDSRLGLSADINLGHDQRVNINQYLDEDRYQRVRIRAINALRQLQSQSIVLGTQLNLQEKVRHKMQTQFNQELNQILHPELHKDKPSQSETESKNRKKGKQQILKDVIKYRGPQSEQGNRSLKFFDSHDNGYLSHNLGNGGMFGDCRDFEGYMLGNQGINMNVIMNLNMLRIPPQMIQYPKNITLKFNKPESRRQKSQNQIQDQRRQIKKLKDTIPKPNCNSSTNSISKIINSKQLFNEEASAQLTNQIREKLRDSRLGVGSAGSSLYGSYKGSRNRIKSESKWIYCNSGTNNTYKHNPIATSTISMHNKPRPSTNLKSQVKSSNKNPNFADSVNITAMTTINCDRQQVIEINNNKGNSNLKSNSNVNANSNQNKNGKRVMVGSAGDSGMSDSHSNSKGRKGKLGGNVNIMRVYQIG